MVRLFCLQKGGHKMQKLISVMKLIIKISWLERLLESKQEELENKNNE